MIIVGLGNPELKYVNTRHNLGFKVVDRLQQDLHGTPWTKESGILWSRIGSHLLIKPQEYMNLSGQSLNKYLSYKKIVFNPATDLVIIHDEIDFPLGTVKIQADHSSGGHQGVQSIIDALGGQNFRRCRIGIGSNREKTPLLPAEDYVLREIPAAEMAVLGAAIDQAVKLLTPDLQK